MHFAVDGERLDVRLARSAWCGNDEWKLRVRQMYCDLVEEGPMQDQDRQTFGDWISCTGLATYVPTTYSVDTGLTG